MKKCFRIILCTVLVLLLFPCGTYAKAEESAKPLKLTLQDAVAKGLENSISLEQVNVEIGLADVSKRRARYITNKLKDGDEELKKGRQSLDKAESLIDQDIAPEDITLANGDVIHAGTKIGDTAYPDEIKNQIRDGIRSSIESGRENLEEGRFEIINSLQEAGAAISDNIDYSSLTSLSVKSTRDMMNTMADVSLEVTQASYDIYKNNIALLIQKSYYDVLQAEKLLELKEKAMERGKKQYEFSKASYEEGIKSKNDMLMASTYYRSTQIECEKAKGDLQNAMTEFKKNINIPLDTEVELVDVFTDNPEEFNLDEGIKNGLQKRLEIKKALGEVVVYDLNFDTTSGKYPKTTFQYQEADLDKQKARLAYKQALVDVESSIRQSYQTLQSASNMLGMAKQMAAEAEESVQIADYKYREGFGEETTLLKKLDIEETAGTIVEVLAAEENLAQVEEKISQMVYGYNLAKMKYLNDTGNFIY